MNTLIVMIGIPGSGKSTYAKELLKLYPDWEYVSRDEVRYEHVTDQAHYFDHEKEVYKEFCNRIDMHLLNGKTVIADATHLNRASRDKLLYSLSVKPDKLVAIFMSTPFEVCRERNNKREGITRVPESNMFRMSHRLSKPNPVSENFDKVYTVKG